MNLKTYQSYTMAEALAAVKHDLGADAVIINTRSFRRGGFLGIGRKTIIEVTATPNVAPRAVNGKNGDVPVRTAVHGAKPQAVGAAANRAYAADNRAGTSVATPPRTQPATARNAANGSNSTFDEKRQRMQRMTMALAEKARRERQAIEQATQTPSQAVRPSAEVSVFAPDTMPQMVVQPAASSPSNRPEKPVMIVGRLVGAEAAPQRAGVASTQPLNGPASTAARRFILAMPEKFEMAKSFVATPVPSTSAREAGVRAPVASTTPNSLVPDNVKPASGGGSAKRLASGVEIEVKSPLPPTAISLPSVVPMPDTRVMQDELAAIKTLVGQVLQKQNQAAQIASPTLPKRLFDVYLRLIAQEVSDEVADQVVNSVREVLHGEDLENDQHIAAAVVKQIAAMIPVAADPLPVQSPDDRPLTIALVGPTGVGKTTTLAKLAASYKIRHEKKVGLITADTYRIAAVEQLRTYAGIIEVPLEVAATPAEMREAMDKLNACEVILIDTAGRSQNDRLRIDELRLFIEAAGPHEVHLVLSSTAGEKVLLREAEAFGAVGIDKIALSKLDEAVGFGGLINVMRKLTKPLSFITTGQEVPDHLEIANAQRLAEMVMGARV